MPYKDLETRKLKQREYSRNWYARNKKQHQAGVAKNKREGRERWIDFKASISCTRCGAQHPAIIDFHHVIRDKDKQSVHKLAAAGSYKKAKKEAEKKCIPLCANCHRILHFEETEINKAERAKKRKPKK